MKPYRPTRSCVTHLLIIAIAFSCLNHATSLSALEITFDPPCIGSISYLATMSCLPLCGIIVHCCLLNHRLHAGTAGYSPEHANLLKATYQGKPEQERPQFLAKEVGDCISIWCWNHGPCCIFMSLICTVPGLISALAYCRLE